MVEDNVDTFTLDLSFDEMWEGFTKRITFYNDGLESSESNPIEMLVEGTSCVVPWEVLQSSGNLFLTVVGTKTDTDEVIVTQIMSNPIKVNVSGRHEGGEPQRPTPDEVTLLIQLANDTKKIAQSVRDDADAGKFKGDQGPKGDKGDTGPQGVQGPRGPQGIQGESGRVKWRMICRDKITEEVTQYIRDVDENSKPLKLSSCAIRLLMPEWSTALRTYVYLNLRKMETGDEDFWSELSLAPGKVSSTSTKSITQIMIYGLPWLHGDIQYSQTRYSENDPSEFPIVTSQKPYQLNNGDIFSFSATNFIDVIQFDTQVDDKFLPAGMVIEVWGADYES
nr:MAG TPA: extracellular matrix protein [Caudoviricetes sp.]